MEELLFLAHRIPYPPDKGDKIRSWNVLKHLAARYRVRLGCLIDDPEDSRHIVELERCCAEVFAAPIAPGVQRLRAMLKTRPGRPLSTGYFHTAALADWVRKTVAGGAIRRAFVFSTPMMALLPDAAGIDAVLDMVDVDSEKWREMAAKSRPPKSWIYAREARTLLAFERRAARQATRVLLSSPAEAALFTARAPEAAPVTLSMLNGVDLAYFSPSHVFASPFDAGAPVIVFTGDMSYWPNVEAVRWFAAEVLPRVRLLAPNSVFAIVGARPTDAVRALAAPGILVTGRVPDIRPYLAHAAAVVAPLLLARGVQNKVLEGMAMGKVVIATAAAEQGLDVARDGAVLVADDAAQMAVRVAETLAGLHGAVARTARHVAEARFGWSQALRPLDALLAGTVAG